MTTTAGKLILNLLNCTCEQVRVPYVNTVPITGFYREYSGRSSRAVPWGDEGRRQDLGGGGGGLGGAHNRFIFGNIFTTSFSKFEPLGYNPDPLFRILGHENIIL